MTSTRHPALIFGACLSALAMPCLADQRIGRNLFLGQLVGAEAATLDPSPRRSSIPMPCAACHGRDARGGQEGGIYAPNITSASLTSRTGRRPAYDRTTFALALRDGRDAVGAQMSRVMPRYEIAEDRIEALLSYLGVVEAEQRRGIAPDEVRLAVAVPQGAGLLGEALTLAFRNAWSALGTPRPNGRRVTVTLLEGGSGPDEWRDLASLDAAALVLSVPDASRQLFRQASEVGIPVFAPLAQAFGTEAPLDLRSVFPSIRDEVQRLVDEAGPAAIFVADDEGRRQIGELGYGGRLVIRTAAEWRAASTRPDRMVLFATSPEALGDLLSADLSGVTIFRLSSASRRAPAASFRERGAVVRVAAPYDASRWQAADLSPERLARVGALIVRDALIDAGRDLTRHRLARAVGHVAVREPNWPELDFQRHPLTGTRQVDVVPDDQEASQPTSWPVTR